jgi:hypothetical protein
MSFQQDSVVIIANLDDRKSLQFRLESTSYPDFLDRLVSVFHLRSTGSFKVTAEGKGVINLVEYSPVWGRAPLVVKVDDSAALEKVVTEAARLQLPPTFKIYTERPADVYVKLGVDPVYEPVPVLMCPPPTRKAFLELASKRFPHLPPCDQLPFFLVQDGQFTRISDEEEWHYVGWQAALATCEKKVGFQAATFHLGSPP